MFDFEEGSEDGDAASYHLPWERVEVMEKGKHGRHGRLHLFQPVVKGGVESVYSNRGRV